MNNPEFVKINNELYPINTDFRVAIECNRISMDETIGDNERCLATIYLLFGDKGLDDAENHNELYKLAIKYLTLNRVAENKGQKNEPDMDFIEDMNFIEASFVSDYNIDLEKTKMHWWKFYNLLCGLSNSEFGNCCVLNRVRNLRNLDLSTIDDVKKRAELAEAKKVISLKNKKQEKTGLNEKQKNNIEDYYRLTGIKRKE